ncbi:MAG: cytochrome d ubiquinol oxidase subunit II [Candidatus Pacebacteria bacterium]|nr:cytochrome d ubiquinol oxidase subunit II [Candidatus Paceibacterota bacterium]
MQENFAFFITCFSLFIYFLLSSIEFGSSLFAVFPNLVNEKDMVNEYLNPIWETTTVFLVFSLTSMFACFPGATLRWGTDLFTLVFTILAIFAVRIICILFKQYSDVKSRFVDILYFLASLVVPILFSLVILYFLTGSWILYIKTSLYFWFALSVIAFIVTMTLAFFRVYKKNGALTKFLRLSGTLFFLSTTFFLITIAKDLPYLFSNNYIETYIASLMIFFIVIILFTESSEKYIWSFIFFCFFMTTLFWALFIAHLPYIIYPTTTLASSVTDSASLMLISWSFVVGMVILLPALFLLYKLFVFKK